MNQTTPKPRDLATLIDSHQTSFLTHRPSLFVLIVSIVITALTFVKMRELEKVRLQNEFEQLSKGVVLTLKDSLQSNLQVVDEISAFYAALGNVERTEFKQFATHIFKRRPDIYMLGWAPRVALSEIETYQKIAQNENIPNFTIKQYDHRGLTVEAKERSEYFPFFYVEPLTRNEETLGLDQMSYSVTAAAMRKSLETGEPASTIIMGLPQFEKEPPASRHGIEVFTPIYEPEAELTTFAQRKQKLRGFAVASFHIRKMLESVFSNIHITELELRIYAEGVREKNKLIYTYNPRRANELKNSWHSETTINVAGHYWKVVCSSTDVFKKNRYRWEAPAVFIIGVLIGFLLAIYIFSFERNRIRAIMVSLSLTDELTQLYNRRGLWLLADEQIRASLRYKRGFWLFVMDLDELKKINDTLGHPEGDRALKRTAQLLQTTFRKSDIISRIGGDEFAVIVLESAPEHLNTLTESFVSQLKKNNAARDVFYPLSISVGAAYFDPENPSSLEDLMAKADKELYAQKKAHRAQKAQAPNPPQP